MITMADEDLLKRMGATAKDPPDPMLVKWLEEREARCIAEAASHRAWRSLEEEQERRELLMINLRLWKIRAWVFGIGAALLACGSILLVVAR